MYSCRLQKRRFAKFTYSSKKTKRYNMEYYNLAEDEVVLYKGDVRFCGKPNLSQLVLTNKNLVFITKTKKLFGEREAEISEYSLDDVKIYEGVPQVKTKSSDVEIYLKSTELEFSFDSKSELMKFQSAITKRLTGKTGFERGAEKVKDKIDVVNDTFGVDVVKSTEDAVKNGLIENITDIFGKVGKLGKALFGKKK